MDSRDSRESTSKAVSAATSFASFYDAHVDEIYRFVHRRCRDHALAEDITQETFLTAVRSVDELNSVSVGWLKQVARNRLLDVLRREARFKRKLQLLRPPKQDSLDSLMAETLRVEAALRELSIDHQIVLTLHYIDGLTIPGLAEELGRSEKSIEGLVTRARRRLRSELGDTNER